MIKIDENYTDYRDDTDPYYPAGKAINASTEEGVDGTPILASLINDINGFRQAAFMAAFGSFGTLSGVPDNAFKSDTLNAINKITQMYTDKEILKEAEGRINNDAQTLEAANSFTSAAVGKEKNERNSADEQYLSKAKNFATDKDREVLADAKVYTDVHAKNKENPHGVTAEQVGLGRLYNISQIGFGVCNTESNVQAKSVVVENIILVVGARITIKFKNGIATDNPTLNVNATGAKPITMDSQPVGKGCFDAGGCYEFVYTGDSWECLSGVIRACGFGQNSGYIKLRNGLLMQFGTGNTFPVAFNTVNYFIIPFEGLGVNNLPIFFRTFVNTKTTTSVQFHHDALIANWNINNTYTSSRDVASPSWFAIGF